MKAKDSLPLSIAKTQGLATFPISKTDMTTKSTLILAAWALTCGGAFMIGRGSDTDTDLAEGVDDGGSAVISRRGPLSLSERSSLRRRSGNPAGESARSSEDRDQSIRDDIQALKALTDPMERAQGFLDFVRRLEADEFLDAIDAFREGGVDQDEFGEYRLLLNAWAQVNPLEALDYASENTGTNLARQTILASWAKSNPQAAIDWARNNFDNKGREDRANPWLVGVIEGLAPLDPTRATGLLEELPFSRERGEALTALFSEISKDGPEAAKQWVARLSDERLKAGAASRLVRTLAESDPRAAAEWAASLGPEAIARASGEIVNRWAADDLPAARAWVEEQPAEVAAAAGPSLVSRIIQQENPVAASNWLAQHEGDPNFDRTVQTFVWRSMEQEPALAADWIMRLSNEQNRAGTFHRVLDGWLERDRDGALNYLANNPVPESIKRRAGLSPTQ